DCNGTGVPAVPPDRRRAYDESRRDNSGTGSGSAEGIQGEVRLLSVADHPRPGNRCRDVRQGGDNVRWTDRRVWKCHVDVRNADASIHRGAAKLSPRSPSSWTETRVHKRYRTRHDFAASGLQVPSAMSKGI